ncbi:SIMPL domain-containing protein [Paenibacillus alvei]|uniref:SIMPL domain-containing protein n=1 Tax=Paenibacillus alvei TaxID=44250 RepID=UPI0018CD04A7|nr:SIMPL domain-containing protein [Paenibacillus alvei]MBG9732870.1 hypothetical protein [Paenibacillus alvei]MBG9742443.1 hypothetical protein [Paenibacillus alvei]MCY9582826.1 SIMPL domain-containing protein [Paenibacillus alvei]MCY9587399.1 SIMPL domain-containing protein [Paenibacillus alvei]
MTQLAGRTAWRRMAMAVLLTGALLVGTGVAAPVPVKAAAAEFSIKDTVSVSGVGELEVTPDVAYAELAVDTRGKTAAEAQKQNAALYDKVKQVLTKKYGIQEKDLKTVNFSVNPEYKYEENKEPQIVGYQAQHAVRVTYRDLNRLGSLVDAATDAGVNRVARIQFDTEKRSDYEAQVLEKAVQHAAKKASALAKAAGREVGAALTITESGADWSPVRVMYDTSNTAEMKKDAATTDLQGGLIKLNAQVQIQYQLK